MSLPASPHFDSPSGAIVRIQSCLGRGPGAAHQKSRELAPAMRRGSGPPGGSRLSPGGSANGPLGPAPDLPDPAGELARHGGVGPAGRLAGVRERLAAAVEPGGSGVGPRAYRRGHVGAGCGRLGPRGAHGVMPRGLYERRARERVAGLGYPAAPLGLAARVLRWREPAPAREGRRRAEPAEGPGLRRC